MLQRKVSHLACVVSALMIGSSVASAEAPPMSAIFGDHAVLQRDRPINVYGRAAAGEEVTVTLADAKASARADAKGSWGVTLPAMGAGGPFVLTARSGSKTQTANDVLVGDVWLCSGQSNMEWPVRMTLDAGSEAALSA